MQVSLEECDAPSDRNSCSEQWYQILVRSGMSGREWTIRRSYQSLYAMDRQLHKCIFDRKTSLLPEMTRDLVDEIGANVSYFYVALAVLRERCTLTQYL